MAAEFRGIKGQKRYDKIAVWAGCGPRDRVMISAYAGDEQSYAISHVSPTTARKIAAELVRLADEIDGGL